MLRVSTFWKALVPFYGTLTGTYNSTEHFTWELSIKIKGCDRLREI